MKLSKLFHVDSRIRNLGLLVIGGLLCAQYASLEACSVGCHEFIILHNGTAGPPSGREYDPYNAFDNLPVHIVNDDPKTEENKAYDVRDCYDTYTTCLQTGPAEGYVAAPVFGDWTTIMDRYGCVDGLFTQRDSRRPSTLAVAHLVK